MNFNNTAANLFETVSKNTRIDRLIISSQRTQFGYLVGVLTSGNTLSTAIYMVGGILMTRLVEPSVLGLFSGIALTLGYARFLQIGVSNGLSRELPYYIGKSDRDHAYELASTAQAWMIFIGGLTALILLMVALYNLIQGDLWLAAGWGAHVVLVFLLFYSNQYLQTTYRTANDFARLSMVNVVHALVSLMLLALVWVLDFYGLCLRAVFTAMIAAGLFHYWRPVRVKPGWNFQHIKHLFFVGAPILFVGQAYSCWAVINQTLVLSYTGAHGMGVYAVVVMISGSLMLFPQSLSQVIYPRMAELFGRGGNIGDLCRMTIKPMLLIVLCMLPLVVAAWWLVGPMIRPFVPKYVEAVPAVQWALLQPLIMCFAVINNVFNVIRRQGLYFVAIICGVIVYGFSLLWLIRGGLSIIIFPQAMLVGHIAFISACYGSLYYLFRRGRSCEK